MNKINNILKKLNYEYDSSTKNFGTNKIKVYTTCKKIEHNKKIVAKYLILDFSSIETKSILDNFDDFQKEFIAEVFYSHRDDIRWNIYTCIVVDSEEFLPAEIYELEKDENYSRKLIFDFVGLEEFLENGFFGNVNLLNQKAIKTDFTLEWNNKLSKVELNGCLYNKMKSESIDDYINDCKPIRTVGRPQKNETLTCLKEKYIIKNINNILLENYRKHCFRKEFSFAPGLINLISGSNGSGKSSICEAISMGMTGSSSSIKKANNQKIELNCINNEGEKVNFTMKKTPKESRELDLTWYGTTTSGSKSRLYENFTVFNYLQPKTIFSNDNCDLQELLKNIIYGEETTKAWKNLQNYKGKFEAQKKRINTKRQEFKIKIDELKKRLLSLTNNNIKTEVLYEDDYDILSILSEDLKIEEKLDIFNFADYNVRKVYEILEKNNKISSLNSIIVQVEASKEKKCELRIKMDKLELLYKKEQQISLNKKSDLLVFKKLISSKKEIEKINGLCHKLYYKEIDDKETQKVFIDKYYKKNAKYDRLSELLNDFKYLKIENSRGTFSVENYEIKLAKYYKLIDEQKCIANRINEKQKDSNLTKKIIDNIFRFAKEYQNICEENSKCPLCGKDYGKPDNFIKAIDNTRNLSENIDSALEILISKNQEYKNKIREMDSELIKEKEKEKKHKEIEDFISRAKKLDLVANDSSVSEIYLKCSDNRAFLGEQLIKDKDIMNSIQAFKSEKLYIEFENQNVIEKFSTFLKEKSKAIKNAIEKNLEHEKNNDLELSVLRQKLLNKDIVYKELKKIQEKIMPLEEIMNCVEEIRKYFSNFDNAKDMKKWCRSFFVAKNIIEEKVKIELNNKYKDSFNIEVVKNQELLRLEDEKLTRCNNALIVFNSLNSLDGNMAKFIESNAMRIEKIFKMIHRPAEFNSLNIKKGNIEFVRKSTKDVIDITSISTGQAMALVFAVTICLHFSSKNIPNLLILDEPVANLDDVHIMNLVDILKEIAMLGVQIFITTANEQVATFFRRKFSCFIEEFKHLEMQRTDEKPSVFTEKTYLPHREEALIKKRI